VVQAARGVIHAWHRGTQIPRRAYDKYPVLRSGPFHVVLRTFSYPSLFLLGPLAIPLTMGATQLQQVYIGFNPNDMESGDSIFFQEHTRLQALLLGMCPAHLWHNGSYTAGCPRPILVGKHHQQQLEKLHESLTIAITDIVQRWWTDMNAGFPNRMPLEKEEENLLKASA
jgi:hypothetical protein